MANFWNSLETFGPHLLGGVGGAVTGTSANIQANAQYNQAIAANITAEQKARTASLQSERQLILIVLFVAFFLPIFGTVIFLLLRK